MIDWIGGVSCPNIRDNLSNRTCIQEHHDSIVAVGLVSSSFSIIGAFFIILTYILFKDLRTKARFVLLMIATSDSINSVSYVFAFVYTAINVYYSLCYYQKSGVELHFCAIQSAVNLFATLASNCWTCVLGIHITCLFYSKNYLDNKYVMGIAHTVCWIGPFILVSFSYIFGRLGPGAQSVNIGWCFVSNYSNSSSSTVDHALIEFFISKLWELVTVFILAIVYTVSACKLCRFNYKKEKVWAFTQRHDFRLIWIPVVYLLLRLWGNVRWVMELTPLSKFGSCPPHDLALAFMQVIGDTGQGWANAILYILFNQAMRRRIYECCRASNVKKSAKIQGSEKDRLCSETGSRINSSNNDRVYFS